MNRSSSPATAGSPVVSPVVSDLADGVMPVLVS